MTAVLDFLWFGFSIITPVPPTGVYDQNWTATTAFAIVIGTLFIRIYREDRRLFWAGRQWETAIRAATFDAPETLSSMEHMQARSYLEAVASKLATHAPAFAAALRAQATAAITDRQKRLMASSSLADRLDVDIAFAAHDADKGYPRWVSPSVVAAGPGLLTSLGILGTFIGLVAGLPAEGTLDDASITTLISGLQTSFRTSIWGLLGSMCLTWTSGTAHDKAQQQIDAFVRWVDDRLRPATQQELLNLVRQAQQDASSSLKTLATDLSPALEQAINNAFTSHLAPALQEMASHSKQITDLNRSATEASTTEQIDGIRRIVDKVVQGLDEALGKNLREAGTQLNAFTASQSALLVSWQEAITKMESSARLLATLVVRQETASKTLLDALKAADGAGQVLATPAANLNSSLTAMKQSAETLQALTTTLSRATDHLNTTTAFTERLSRDWQAAAMNTEKVANELTAGMSGFAEKFPKAINNTLISFDQQLALGVQRLAGSTNELKNTMDDLVDRLGIIAAKPTPPASTPTSPVRRTSP